MSEHGEQTAREAPTLSRVGYAPITRVNAERREIELCATSEALDAHGTIFDYTASKDAFTRWMGNVREMHQRRAVGRRVGVRCDDADRRIYVRLRISRGAQDTWEKVVDGTLRGASIGASDVTWRRERRTVGGRNRWVNVASRYDLAELSLVDNPSNPDALGVVFVRDATPDVALLDPLDQPETPETVEETVEVESDVEAPELAVRHTPANPLHAATRMLLASCDCPHCAVALAALADDEDAESVASGDDHRGASGAGNAALFQALVAGLRLNATRLGQFDATLSAAVAALQRPAEQADQTERVQAPDRDEAQAARVVEALEARLTRLEAQPVGGGPAAHPVEKTLASSFGGLASGDEVRALEALAGRLRDPQAQLAVAAEMIRLQQRPGGE